MQPRRSIGLSRRRLIEAHLLPSTSSFDLSVRSHPPLQLLLTRSDALQTLEIIRREPTPVPLEDRPGEDLSAEELPELVKRLKVRAPSRTASMNMA